MQTAGARALREHETEDMSREAVLLQWERKIEAAERAPYGHHHRPAHARSAASALRDGESDGPARAAWPLGLPPRPLSDGRGGGHRAGLAFRRPPRSRRHALECRLRLIHVHLPHVSQYAESGAE